MLLNFCCFFYMQIELYNKAYSNIQYLICQYLIFCKFHMLDFCMLHAMELYNIAYSSIHCQYLIFCKFHMLDFLYVTCNGAL